jgi:hypothetical protein
LPRFQVATHGTSGLRERYFADDDQYDLKTMFQREKLGTAEDQDRMFARLSGKVGQIIICYNVFEKNFLSV